MSGPNLFRKIAEAKWYSTDCQACVNDECQHRCKHCGHDCYWTCPSASEEQNALIRDSENEELAKRDLDHDLEAYSDLLPEFSTRSSAAPSARSIWLARAESPIERLLLDTLADRIGSLGPDFECYIGSKYWMFIPQHSVLNGRYRLDLAIIDGAREPSKAATHKIAIECDGHDWHERTKEQARRDKARDRALTADGWAVLRYTGSEIHDDVDYCVGEILALVKARS